MPTPLCPFDPTSTNYRFRPANNVIAAKLDGGASRRRLDIVGGAHYVECTWILNKRDYTRLEGFFRERLLQGTRPFRLNMLTEVAFVMPHVCICAEDQPELIQQEGDSYRVRTVLEVTPNPTKSYGLSIQSDADDRVIAGDADGTVTAEMNEFPIGRQIVLTGTQQSLVTGAVINLDGTYTINAKPTVAAIGLANATTVTTDWTVLNGTTPDIYFPVFGACILVPE